MSLLTIAGGIFAQGVVSNRLLVFSDAALTAKNVLSNQPLFYASFTVYLIEMTCGIAGTALFYRLLSPVNRNVALVGAFVDLSANIIKTMSRLFYIVPLAVLTTASHSLSAFNPEQLRALALLLFRLNDRGAAIAVAMFGVSGICKGYLVSRSTFLPRVLGIFMMIGAAGWLRFYYPPLRVPSFTVIAVFVLCVAAVEIFWLLVYGVDEEKWKRVNAAA